MDLHLHDKVELKKAHPCGSHEWEVLRIGADFRLKCMGCGHQIMIPRRQAEKNIKEIIGKQEYFPIDVITEEPDKRRCKLDYHDIIFLQVADESTETEYTFR